MTPAEIFVNMQNSENTKRAYRNDIRKWEQFVKATGGEEDAATAITFKAALIENYSASTAQRVWCTVAAFYGWMKGTGRSTATPFHGIKSPSRPTDEAPPVPSDNDVAKLVRACEDGTTHGAKAAIAINLLLNGLRANEVCGAEWDNLVRDDLHNQWILKVLGKGDRWRSIPLTSGSQQAIFEYHLNHSDPEHTYVLPGVNGQRMNPKTVWRMVDWFSAKAGVKGMHPHALRHHYATRLVRAGVDIFTLQKLMGHKRADTTQRYVGLDYTDLSKALEIDPLHHADQVHDSFGFTDDSAKQIKEQVDWDTIPLPF
jgi:integrase/recombinase XerD